MTEIGFIIQPGESIPEDVTGVSDTDGDVWWLTSIDHWHLGDGGGEPRGCEGTVELQRARVRANAPLTVTAVGEQPADPEPTHDDFKRLAGIKKAAPAAEPELVDVLDLVRQYASQRYMHGLGIGGALPDTQGHEASAAALFARIEAEVNRLRAERDEQLAQTKRYSQVIEHQAAELERLKPAPNAPLVLSLPGVPEGTVALIGHKSGRRYEMRDGWWRWGDEDEPHWNGTFVAVLAAEGSVSVEMVPPREPRTWPKLDDAPDDLRKVEVRQPDGMQFVAVRRYDGRWVSTIAHPNPEAAERYETFSWSELLGEGDVCEVLDDKEGTR